MEIAITKGQREDRISVARPDSSRVETVFPHKGPIPHDAVHVFVERALGLGNAFWGMVADGRHPEEIASLAKAAGHASSARAQVPDAAIIELLQAERLVECFEADFWGGGTGDAETFIAVAESACAASYIAPPPLSGGAIARIRSDIAAFARDWQVAKPGYVARLTWG
jgi:hypothetical protein